MCSRLFLRRIGIPYGRTSRYDTHPEIVKRLRRAEGHLKSVIAMIEEGRLCIDIAQQLQAVEKAFTNVKRTLIQDHLDHCLDDTVSIGSEC